MKVEKRIKQLEDLIPKLKGNKKILPQRIEALEWELRALKAEAYAKQSEDVNHLYGLYFDKTLGDGLSPEEAAEELGLA